MSRLVAWAQDEVEKKEAASALSSGLRLQIAHRAANHYLTVLILRCLAYLETCQGTRPLRKERVGQWSPVAQAYGLDRRSAFVKEVFEYIKQSLHKLSIGAANHGQHARHRRSNGTNNGTNAYKNRDPLPFWLDMISY